MVPWPKSLVSKLRSQEPECRKIALGSIQGWDGFCSSDPKSVLGLSPDDEVLLNSKRKRKNTTKANVIRSGEDISGAKITKPEIVLSSGVVNVFGLGIIISLIFNDTWPSGWHTHEPRMKAPTVGITTPTQDAIVCVYEPRNANRHDTDTPTPSAGAFMDATPTLDFILTNVSPGKPQHMTLERTSSVLTPLVAMSTQNTKTKPLKASRSNMARCWKTKVQRRDAKQYIMSTPLVDI